MNQNSFKISNNNLQKLKNGAIGIIPTDTVYGIVTLAKNKTSVARLYELKKRDRKPGTIIASNLNQLLSLGIDLNSLDLASRFWPGSVSVVIPCGTTLKYLHLGVGSLAFRLVSDKKIYDLLLETGPLLTSSANLPNMPIANNIKEAKKYFGKSVDLYINGGDLSDRLPSSIIKIENNNIIRLR